MFDALVDHQNIFLCGQTGCGKTLGALVAVLTRIDRNDARPQAIVISSTHEAAIQLYELTQSIDTGITIATAVQGEDGKF